MTQDTQGYDRVCRECWMHFAPTGKRYCKRCTQLRQTASKGAAWREYNAQEGA